MYGKIFEETIEILETCKWIMRGDDIHDCESKCDWEDYMSLEEFENMTKIIELCRGIVNDVETGKNVSLED